jgi:DNA-binding response OmpR family regulator
VAETKTSLLVVEDDPDVAEMLNAYFRVQGYDVNAVHWGEDAVSACRTTRPDLVILDIRLPDIDGYEVARRLRGNRRTEDIPIIFLTEKRSRADRLQGLELGADDYITKPFDIQELRLRVRNALRRSQQNALINPVTSLPEGALVDERLSECLEDRGWALLGVRLENLEAFREAYGFVASDDVLRAISLMIHNAVRELGGPSDFVGQVSPTEFVVVTTHPGLPALTERIRTRLAQSLDHFYPLKDRGKEAVQEKRLGVRIEQVLDSQGPYTDLKRLKADLFGHGRKP